MTFPRKVGLVLLIVALLAAASHRYGISLPSLRWFYSFSPTPDAIFAAEVKEQVIQIGKLR